MSTKFEVRDWIDGIATTSIKQFYPTFAAKSTNIPLNIVFKHLLELVQSGELLVKWEIRCPECYAKVQVENDNTYEFDEQMTCIFGHEFHLDPSLIFPVFELEENFKEYKIKKKLQIT